MERGTVLLIEGELTADLAREAQQIARLHKLADTAKLDVDFAETFLSFPVKEVIRHHEAFPRKPPAKPASD